MVKIALLCSTAASVARYSFQFDKDARVDLVITDRDCGAANLASQLVVPLYKESSADREAFCSRVLEILKQESIDYLLSFYTKLLIGGLLHEYKGRILNFHPSLLPACPGQRGFEDTMNSGALVFGSTAHLVDEGMDTGRPVLQTIAARSPVNSTAFNRHQVFAQQCAAYSQIVRWLREGRLEVTDTQAVFLGADYSGGLSVPSFDGIALGVYESLMRKGPD